MNCAKCSSVEAFLQSKSVNNVCKLLLGDFGPRHPTGASPLDSIGGLTGLQPHHWLFLCANITFRVLRRRRPLASSDEIFTLSCHTRCCAVCVEEISFFWQTTHHCFSIAENLSISDVNPFIKLLATTCLKSQITHTAINTIQTK